MIMPPIAGSRAIAALITILGTCLILAILGLGMGFISYHENAISFSYLQSRHAYLIAQSGVSDALYKISQNKDYENLGGYAFSVSGGTSTVIVGQSTTAGITTVTSTGRYGPTYRVIEATLAVDAATGRITILNWREASR
jgi:Tfp pilus assembly protein PilX